MYRVEVVERVQLLLDLPRLSRQPKKKHMVKPNNINKCHNLRGLNLSSVHYNFVLDVRQSYVRPQMRVRTNPASQKKLRNYQLHEIENKYFTTIQETHPREPTAASGGRRPRAHPSYSNTTLVLDEVFFPL